MFCLYGTEQGISSSDFDVTWQDDLPWGESEADDQYGSTLAAGDLKLDLWYSADRQWLALESEVRGGRKLRYVLDDQAPLQAGEYSFNTADSLAQTGAANSPTGG